ncbi:hypothetical protein [Haloplanus pelagicus]|uniref:hypothetical protein n=1 Tax=Haloplanus pelagicus TaxID=2949995 RepID=UPI00203D6441|nr:hypothetical protein [Haloplanus sp. HW8-1]
MTRRPQSSVRDRLDALDPAARTDLVAAVYEARGWETDRVEGAVLATPPGEEEPRRLVPATRPAVARADADGVVDAADLRELLRYAVGPEERGALCRRFFDREPSELDDWEGREDGTASHDGGTDDDRSADDERAVETGRGRTPERPTATADGTRESAAVPDRRSTADGDDGRGPRRWLAVGLVALLVVGGAVAVAVDTGVDPSLAGGDGSPGPAPTATAPEDGRTGNDTEDGQPAVMERQGLPFAPGGRHVSDVRGPFPPGADAGGVENASALADAHEAALSNRSYRLAVDHREYVDGRPTGRVRERSIVAGSTRYRSSVVIVGRLRTEPRAVADASSYADGGIRYRRLGGEMDVGDSATHTTTQEGVDWVEGSGWRSSALPADRDRFARRTAATLERLLDGSETSVVGEFEREGRTHLWIAVDPDPTTDAAGSVLVDDRGLVHGLHYEYVPPNASARVVVTIHVTPTPDVRVSPPAWVDRDDG